MTECVFRSCDSFLLDIILCKKVAQLLKGLPKEFTHVRIKLAAKFFYSFVIRFIKIKSF
jgi:hypothetical protein